MKEFFAPFIKNDLLLPGFDKEGIGNSPGDWQQIDQLLWSSTGYKPDVKFSLAYTADAILLTYRVKEKNVKADYRNINDPVYKDSCVEVFIAFNNEKEYYNLEFNAIGTPLGGYGVGKNDRIAINEQLLKTIISSHFITAPGKPDEWAEWVLALQIPFTVFEHHHILSLKSQVCDANFYKCGDDLPEPHYLSWNNIDHPYPNFHLPESFGKVHFVY